MAKRDRTRIALDKLAEAVEDPHGEPAAAAITKALSARSNLVVAAALAVIHEHELRGFEDAMQAAFADACVDPVERDPGCRTKLGVAKALDALREPADELFLAGARFVQKEPVWGGSQDTAAVLRGSSAMALVHRRHPDALFELARLLADPEREARRLAAEAVAVNGDAEAGCPLLVLRVGAGEDEPEVLGACFAGLLSLGGRREFEFVVAHLHDRNAIVVESAALALGQERPDGALDALRELVDRSFAQQRRVAMLAVAMLRSDAAWGYLLEFVGDGGAGVACDAIEALSVYRELGDLRERVRGVIEGRRRDRDFAPIDAAFREHFSG